MNNHVSTNFEIIYSTTVGGINFRLGNVFVKAAFEISQYIAHEKADVNPL